MENDVDGLHVKIELIVRINFIKDIDTNIDIDRLEANIHLDLSSLN